MGSDICYLSKNGKAANCEVIIAFAVLAWLALIAIIVTHCLKYFDKPFLPYLVEACIFAGLAFVWFIIAMVGIKSTEGYSVSGDSFIVAVRFFSWINILLHLASAVIAFLSSRVAGGKVEEAAPAQHVPGAQTASV